MKIALVSPYSWTYPGGVTRHIEALAGRFLETGHEVRVLAPHDPDDRRARWLHRGATPAPRPIPDYVVPLGRTIGFPANGAVSNVSVYPDALTGMRRELRTGGYDVVHVHEPNAPMLGWDACLRPGLPIVGTFHCYSENRGSAAVANLAGARRIMNHLHVRVAVSDAAAWTGRRFYGGEYRVIPNGVDLAPPTDPARFRDDGRLNVAFVGQAVERKGLPVLLRAFEALREHVPATLRIVGATPEEVEPLLLDARDIVVLGKVSDAEKHAVLRDADVLAAPSLGGESFGMVLTEAFAAGTPVVASDIAGYRDVARNGHEGILVPRGDARELAEALRDLWLDPHRRTRLATRARERAQRFAWPQVAAEVLEAYGDAIELASVRPEGRRARLALRAGLAPADGIDAPPETGLRSLEPPLPAPKRRVPTAVRRGAVALGALGGLALSAVALQRIGVDNILTTLVDSSPVWVLAGLALMCLSMVVRGFAWYEILVAALPDAIVRRRDALQGTFIGVLMSATLPARLGEPSRAFIVARRVGRPRESLPVVLGTLVSQTLLNILALVLLGIVMFSTIGLFRGHEGALMVATIVPVVLLVAVLALPALLRTGAPSRSKRLATWLAQARSAMRKVRQGLRVFRDPKRGALATVAQLTAWTIQWMSCYVLLVALGLEHQAGIGAAAAVLFAVNITAVLPATPSNLGVFQAACVAVLSGAYGVKSADALGYGIILQAVEVATALIMGMPALVKEGVSWKDVRLRAMHATPVRLGHRAEPREALAAEAETP